MYKDGSYKKASEYINHYCVYRFLDKDNNILYIGKSKRLKLRIFDHIKGRTHLSKECISQIQKVEYLEFGCECDMNLFELYCISYFQPPYNKDCKSETGLIQINIPEIWNELDLKTLDEILSIPPIVASKEPKILFNKDIFLDQELSDFIKEHTNKELFEKDKKQLTSLCKLSEFNINEVNNYILYNTSNVQLFNEDNKILLKKLKRNLNGYGSICKVKIHNNDYLSYRIIIDKNRKSIYGKTREEIADKIESMMNIYN